MAKRLAIFALGLVCLAGTSACASDALTKIRTAVGGTETRAETARADLLPGPQAPVLAEGATDIDRALNTFLAANGDKMLLLPHKLDKSKLDFSVDSLKIMDDWLQAIHTINKIEAGEGKAGGLFTADGRGDNSVMFAGLYLGEVVRQNARDQIWVWQSFEVFVAKNPAHATQLEGAAGFDEYLLVSPQGVATPGNAALKRVLNGPIDSLHYIGTFLLAPVDLDRAIRGTDMTGLPPMPPALSAQP